VPGTTGLTEVKDMRRKVGFLGAVTSLALAAVLVTAGPAQARRNLGGFNSHCVPPGNAVIGPHGPGLGANCICIIEPTSGQVLLGPNGKCPPGNDPARKK
jgi:hypothetical protein